MNEYLVRTSSPSSYDPEAYRCVVQSGTIDADTVLDILHTEDPTLPGDTLIGAWEFDGSPIQVDLDAYQQIRPFGNNPDGSATQQLLYHYYDGEGVRKLTPEGLTYPPDLEPFDAECRHKYFDTPATPSATGWGFRVELVGNYLDRDPTARAIGVYSDPECTQYLWTTGALQQGPSDWQVDDQGDPLTVWFTNSWDGDRPDEPKDWHIAFLKGSAQEGHQTLPATWDGIRYLFWDRIQGADPDPGATWVDTGLTIIAQAGQAYRLSGVPSGLTIGQALRLGPTTETKLKGYWPVLLTPSDYIQIDPFAQVGTGVKLWKWA